MITFAGLFPWYKVPRKGIHRGPLNSRMNNYDGDIALRQMLGGLRVIYFVRYEPNEFWMLTMYAKAKDDNVPAHILKQLVEAFQNG